MPVDAQGLVVDRIDTLECVERNGVIRSLTREVRAHGLSSQVDYNVLVAAMNRAGVPQYGATLTSAANRVEFGALSLIERAAKAVANDDKDAWSIMLKYEHLMDGPFQYLMNPSSGFIMVRGRSSVTEKETNFFQYKGDQARPRVQILVSHTYPFNTEVPLVRYEPDYPGQTQIQGGEIKIPFPQDNVKMEGVIRTNDPWYIKGLIHRKLNKYTWLGKPPRHWCCTEVEFDCINPRRPLTAVDVGAEARLYRFALEFQENFDGWDPTVTFIDKRTGLPPHNVEFGTQADATAPGAPEVLMWRPNEGSLTTNATLLPAGYWEVPALPETDYSAFFGATII